MNVIIKIVLTALLLMIAGYPYILDKQVPGGLTELQTIGLIPGLLMVITFFIAIAFYCRSLQKTLENIKPKNRTRSPKSVWYMYLIPFNFVEDFFIVIDITNSLKNEAKTNTKLIKFGDFGLTLGIGWSVAQLFSFTPNIIGQISSLVGMILWIIHWVLIHKINKELCS